MKLSASKLLDNLKKMKELEVSDIKQEHQKLIEKDEWFDLVWQKKQTINRYMDIIERLYDWMISHVKGEILAINQAFVVQPDIICNGIEVHVEEIGGLRYA